MDNSKLIQFLAEKIEEIQYAIFYCHSNSRLRINNAVITSSKVDDNGRITFLIDRPHQLISQFEQEFPVGLNYFRKGKNYFMNVLGKARIVTDPEDLSYHTYLTDLEQKEALTTKALVVVTVSTIDFHDTDFDRKNLLLKKIWSLSSSIFNWFGTASRTYNIGEPASLHQYGF